MSTRGREPSPTFSLPQCLSCSKPQSSQGTGNGRREVVSNFGAQPGRGGLAGQTVLFLLSISSPTLRDSVTGFSLLIPCSEIPGPSIHLRAFIGIPYCMTLKPGFPVQVDLLSSPAATHPILCCLTSHDDNGLIPLPMMPMPASPPNFITAVVPPSTRARTLGIFLDSPLSHQSLPSVNFTFYTQLKLAQHFSSPHCPLLVISCLHNSSSPENCSVSFSPLPAPPTWPLP